MRCRQPLAVDSASGLCDLCSKALETSRQQGTSAGSNDDRTRSQAAGPNAATLTAGFEVDATKGWSGPGRIRAAPEGYDLFRYLGGGGMGDVFLAREHYAERLVAIKFLRPTGNPSTKDRFLNEVRALGRIDHPNVVRVISVELDRTDPYYTMEFGAGGTLADGIKSEGPYAFQEAVRLVSLLCDAVAATHEAGIFHRDIKPSNVILTADGIPKLSDYGLAKLAEDQDGLTRTTQAIGTPAFMPPEQISRRSGEISPATDVYGLGATLYAMLTGKAPFEGDSNEDIISKVQTQEPLRPRKFRPDLPMGLEAVVMKCLEKRPADRYASSDDLAKDLLEQKAAKLTRRRRVKKWLVRNCAPLGLLTLAALAAAVLLHYLPAEQPRDRAEQYRKDLADGKPVELIGATGLPLRAEWRLNATRLEISRENQACTFESIESAILELTDDPGIDRYSLRGEFRQLRSKLVPEVKKPDDQEAPPSKLLGLYFSDCTPSANPAGFRAFLTLCYDDYLTPEVLKAGITQSSAQMHAVAMVAGKKGRIEENLRGLGRPSRFTPAAELPGDWRAFRVEISPEGVRAFFRESLDDRESLVSSVSAADISTCFGELRKSMALQNPQVLFDPSPWHPRMPMGVWCRNAGIEMRRVWIEPLRIPSP
ncbi:MAG: serine/threonine-protein kinase [Gemmataceae bacterium]